MRPLIGVCISLYYVVIQCILADLQAGLGTIDQVLIIVPNEAEICLDFPIEDDQIALEGIETLTFTLTFVDILPNVTLGDPDTTNVGIMDDDGKLSLSS